MAGISRPINQDQFFGTPLEQTFSPTKRESAKAAPRILTEADPLPSSHRLVVILPDAIVDIFALSKKLWNLAAPDRRQLLLMIRPNGTEDETQLRINLATLASLIRDSRVAVQTQWIAGTSVDQAIRQSTRADDVIVCFEEHRVSSFLKKNRLADILAQKTVLPIYTLKDAVHETAHPLSTHLTEIALMAFCLVVLIGFFVLEAWIDQNTTGTFQTVLELLAVFSEVWIIITFLSRSFKG